MQATTLLRKKEKVPKNSKPLFRKFEYWDWWWFYIPLLPAWAYLALKTRSLTFFTAVNPAVPGGGFLFEDKWSILELIPPEFVPKSYFKQIGLEITGKNLNFPLIGKPVLGQRGRGVQKLDNFEQLKAYHLNSPEDYIIQEYIDSPYEFAVFYSRVPGEKNGIVSSITAKAFMSVQGDGQSNLTQLMEKDERFSSQIERLSTQMDLTHIPEHGEKVLLEPIGNHCRGTKFLDARHLISSEVHQVFDRIVKGIPNFYYGRFDLRVEHPESLKTGKGIYILELNGVTADVAHIFHPNYSVLQAYKDVWWHWKRMALIAQKNIRSGNTPQPVKKVWNAIKVKFQW